MKYGNLHIIVALAAAAGLAALERVTGLAEPRVAAVGVLACLVVALAARGRGRAADFDRLVGVAAVSTLLLPPAATSLAYLVITHGARPRGLAPLAAVLLTLGVLAVWLPLRSMACRQAFADAWTRYWVGRRLTGLCLDLDGGGEWRSDEPGAPLTLLVLDEAKFPDGFGDERDWQGLGQVSVLHVRPPEDEPPAARLPVPLRTAPDVGLRARRLLRTRLRALPFRPVWYRRVDNVEGLRVGEFWRRFEPAWTAASAVLLAADGRVIAACHGGSPEEDGFGLAHLVRRWLDQPAQAAGASRWENAASVPRSLLGS